MIDRADEQRPSPDLANTTFTRTIMPIETLHPIGRTVVEVRPLTDEEMEMEGWGKEEPPLALRLDDNTLLVPSADIEGNGPGHFIVFGLVDLTLLVGHTITDERPINNRELNDFGWYEDKLDGRPVVYEFGRVAVYPAADSTRKRAGTVFGNLPDGTSFIAQVAPQEDDAA